jgi:hypothetical protein
MRGLEIAHILVHPCTRSCAKENKSLIREVTRFRRMVEERSGKIEAIILSLKSVPDF